MKKFKQFVQESLNPYKHTKVEEDDVDQPTWRFEKSGHPVVTLPKGHLEASKRHFKDDPKGFNKYWHHPFLGVIPHEHDEAHLTKKLITSPEQYQTRYNKATTFKDTKLADAKSAKVATNMNGKSSQYLDDYMTKSGIIGHGGDAHELLVTRGSEHENLKRYELGSKNKQYNSYVDKHENAIEKIRKTLGKEHHLTQPVLAKDIWKNHD